MYTVFDKNIFIYYIVIYEQKVTFLSNKSLFNQTNHFSIEQFTFQSNKSFFDKKIFVGIEYSLLKFIFDKKMCIYYILPYEEKVTFWSNKTHFNRSSHFSIEQVTFQSNKSLFNRKSLFDQSVFVNIEYSVFNLIFDEKMCMYYIVL